MIGYRSVNFRNTSLDERERFLAGIHPDAAGASVLLQTCNRTELYFGEGDVPDEVARHLFRVVCGLESAIVGENAVQGQVKEAYAEACRKTRLPGEMHRLFETALRVGKRVRSETRISQGSVSHALAAIELLREEEPDLENARVAVIGVNKLTRDVVRFLRDAGVGRILLGNRTESAAREMAEPFGVDVFGLEEKREVFAETDVVVTATSAEGNIVLPGDFPKDRPVLVVDLAFPRDVAPEAGALPNVRLYNIRDVEERVRRNISVRTDEVRRAEELIEEAILELKEDLARRRSGVRPVRVIARGSRLSRVQVREVMSRFPEIPYTVEFVESLGDRRQDLSLLEGEAPDDFFTRELDEAILSGRADVAIHSAKDLPAHPAEGIETIAVYEAEDATDALVSAGGLRLSELPPGARVGTSSPLRREGLLALRPDLRIVGIRGCIEERVRRVRDGEVDAAVIATCALKRLGMESEIAEILPFAAHPMQGRLAVVARRGRDDLRAIFSAGSVRA
ncbi:MAG: hydroxymethylbilane synthase [Fibrobacterales bacterium]|nr:hydroxymethylbilane synthase [Fibrobacterales bacterium]